MEITIKGIKSRKNDYVVKYERFSIGDFDYKGCTVKSSNKDYVKLEVTLIAEQDSKSRRISFGLLDNNNIVTLKRKSTFGVKLAYQLTSVVQQSIKAVSKYRKKIKQTNEGGDTNNASKSTKEKASDVSKKDDKKDSKPNKVKSKVYKSFSLHPDDNISRNNTCMVTSCEKEATIPKGNPIFCQDHNKLYV